VRSLRQQQRRHSALRVEAATRPHRPRLDQGALNRARWGCTQAVAHVARTVCCRTAQDHHDPRLEKSRRRRSAYRVEAATWPHRRGSLAPAPGTARAPGVPFHQDQNGHVHGPRGQLKQQKPVRRKREGHERPGRRGWRQSGYAHVYNAPLYSLVTRFDSRRTLPTLQRAPLLKSISEDFEGATVTVSNGAVIGPKEPMDE
jgi:hypothetical protein